MKNSLIIILSVIVFSFCKNLPTDASLAQNNALHMTVKTFGADITDANSISVQELTAKLTTTDSVPMKLVGKVDNVCQVKGCWMNVKSESGEGLPVFVQFKDYGFFMPKDCAGKKVVFDGLAYKAITPVDELKHYAKDKGATDAEIAAITEPKEELKFLASGVLLYEK